MTPKLRIAILLVLPVAMAALAPAQDEDLSRFVTPEDLPVRKLEVKAAFDALTETEKKYAHWMSVASWLGAEITFRQLSEETPDLLALLIGIYDVDRVALRKAASRAGVSDEELHWMDQYTARFLSNCGNYLSFGDSKFVPRISADKMGRVVRCASRLAGEKNGSWMRELWERRWAKMYSLHSDERFLGLEDKGTSAYYSENLSRAEIELVNAWMVAESISPYNTRIRKCDDTGVLQLLTASALMQPSRKAQFRGRTIEVVYGDHADVLKKVVRAFGQVLKYTANENQRNMVLDYIAHFNGGDIDDHKNAMRYWVKDVGPVVETNVGFIESYRDPMGVRGEWEGFVSIVNKQQTEKFSRLVAAAPAFVAALPWGKDFEKDTYHRPDFTSLDVLAFANSGIPAGINIPNYDEIRQDEGFKNVSLGNVLSSSGGGSKRRIPFLEDADQELYRKKRNESFEVQVGLHELLGHGTGKLLYRNEDGSYNFDRGSVKNPLTGQPVTKWYEPGQTWNSQFSRIASSYEECRAEAVGLYLSLDKPILEIFGHTGEDADDITYVNWLSMARAGVSALTFYDPATQKWGQAHMQGRYALMKVMLEAGGGLLELYEKDGHWYLHLDRSKIATVGKKAIGEFLTELMYYKSTADVEAGSALYEKWTTVPDEMMKVRKYVFSSRRPRHIWVQPVTDIDAEGRVILREYPATYRGVIDSFLDRYSFMRGK